jgi:hypothetical protein
MSVANSMVAVDAGMRIAKCFSYIDSTIKEIGVAAVVAVTDRGIVDKLILLTTDPETRPYEEELIRHYAQQYDTCVFDGVPSRICKRNMGVIKNGRVLEGWRCLLAGPYVLCSDHEVHEVNEALVKAAIKLNAAAHRYAYDTAKHVFRYMLLRRRCIMAEGVHPIPELSYFTK